jgi:hypothetical protein
MLRTALIAALLCTAGPAMAQMQPGSAAPNQPQHAPAQPGAKAAAAPAPDKPVEKLDPAKDAAIRHLMDLTQTSKMGDNLNAAITRQVREVITRSNAVPPDQIPKFMDTFSQKFGASAPASGVTDVMVPVYARNFTMEEVQGLTKFYESPLGQHVVKVMPEVVQESQTAGADIDQKAAITTLRSMITDYPKLKDMLPPDPSAPATDTPSSTISPVPPASNAPAAPPQPAPKLAPSGTPPQK